MARLALYVPFLLLAFANVCLAQDAGSQPTPPTESQCREELLEQAERSFDKRIWGSENLAVAERLLTNVVRLCEENPASLQAREHLRVVHEELADHNLQIALFYLAKAYERKGGKAGAVSRLKSIIERYPEYSKLDQVLFLLGEVTMNDRRFDEAAGYYRRLIRAYPVSQYIGEASLRLSAIDLLKIERIEPTLR